MNLTEEDLKELNGLLRNSNLDLPKFRRSITRTGGNFIWLQKNIWIRNKHLDERLILLLGLKQHLLTENSHPVENQLPQKEVLAKQNVEAYNKMKKN